MNFSDDCQNKSVNFTKFVNLFGDFMGVYEAFTIKGSLHRVIIPIWLILGIPGSIFCVIVWTRPKMLHTSSVYLAALGASDLGFFICQFVWFLKTAWRIDLLNVPVFCELFAVINFFLQYLSPLFTFAFTLERFILICFPFKGERFLSVPRAISATLIITLIAFLLSLIQGYFFEYKPEIKECIERSSVVQEGTWQNRLLFYWNLTTETVIFGLIPLSILILNLFVIKETKILQSNAPVKFKLIENRKNLTYSKNTDNRNASTTVMLLSISFYFILSTLPVTIMQLLIIHNFWNGDECLTVTEVYSDPVWQAHFKAVNVKSIIETLALSHYSAKFYIYMITGFQFRIQFFTIFKRHSNKQMLFRRNGLESQNLSLDNYRSLEACNKTL